MGYERIFAPRTDSGPSGFRDAPRPFVFRAAHLDGCTFAADARFEFHIHLFDQSPSVLNAIGSAFAEVANDGLGLTRGKADLLGVEVKACSLDFVPNPDELGCIELEFVTPTELKAGNEIAAKPEFPILMARVRDRISTLSKLYGTGPLDIDFRDLGLRARDIGMTKCELERTRHFRRSTRTRQSHPIGGFTGRAVYEGELAPFLPYLRAAQYTGVGRQTTWGKGELRVWPRSQRAQKID